MHHIFLLDDLTRMDLKSHGCQYHKGSSILSPFNDMYLIPMQCLNPRNKFLSFRTGGLVSVVNSPKQEVGGSSPEAIAQ